MFEETGHETLLERVKAFERLILNLNITSAIYKMSDNAREFVEEWAAKFARPKLNLKAMKLDLELPKDMHVTAKQYFWCLDLYNKHCL